MNHVFTPEKGYYGAGFASAQAQRCFEDPRSIATLKVHGECCMLMKQPIRMRDQNEENEEEDLKKTETEQQQVYEWIFCTRLDTRGKPYPENHIPIPFVSGIQPPVFQKHSYCFIPLPKDLVSGKGSKKTCPGPDTYGAIRAGVESGALPDPNGNNSPDFVSVEWIGKKHQGNVDCLVVDHAITVHGSTVVDIPERSRSFVESMARNVSIEGVVFQSLDTGERFKLRFDMLVPDSLFAINCKKPVSTPDTTHIKPVVIQQT